VNINDLDASKLTRFEVPIIKPPNAACNIDTYEMVEATAGIALTTISGSRYVIPSNKATQAVYTFKIKVSSSTA